MIYVYLSKFPQLEFSVCGNTLCPNMSHWCNWCIVINDNALLLHQIWSHCLTCKCARNWMYWIVTLCCYAVHLIMFISFNLCCYHYHIQSLITLRIFIVTIRSGPLPTVLSVYLSLSVSVLICLSVSRLNLFLLWGLLHWECYWMATALTSKYNTANVEPHCFFILLIKSLKLFFCIKDTDKSDKSDI